MTLLAVFAIAVVAYVLLWVVAGCANVLVWLAEQSGLVTFDPPIGELDPDDFADYIHREANR